MNFVSMKMPKSNKETLAKECCCGPSGSEDRYPHGLEPRFENEQVIKIPGMADVKGGEKVIMHCECYVSSIQKREKKDGKTETNVSFQITGVSLERPNKPKDSMSMDEYKKSRGM